MRGTGEQSRHHYLTWAEFSAGYTLGRCLQYDGGEFGHWYTTSRDVHHMMVNHPASPWLHIPFRF
ncbi:DUF1266 domain-containing protein [Streptomonospora litoralis]|uniref:DUF1266 domain-containing protein n=1 Tax=Streptomonospora litoralis TaxID=2498135 RepID=A0A4P6Q9K6_9ACTN|nr:DUF1266 domain-containing protein [Streptomonospora litoralis]QBI55767.1 hypothetical protein EKD16_20020 [Streptomonospora litoralis]